MDNPKHSESSAPRSGSPKQYTMKDLVCYSAFFAGVIGTFYALVPLGWGHWPRVAVGVLVGMACGFVTEIGYRKWVEEPREEYRRQMQGERRNED